jgi:hypothetical protein
MTNLRKRDGLNVIFRIILRTKAAFGDFFGTNKKKSEASESKVINQALVNK